MPNTINKVVYDGNVLIDLTDLDVTAGDVVNGVTFIMADGTKAVGSITIPTKTSDLVNDSGFITADDIVVEDVTVVDNLSVSAGSYEDGTKSVAKTGYTPVGIVGFRCYNASTSGSNGALAVVSNAYLSGTGNATANYRVANRSTSNSMKVQVHFRILYKKS